MADTMWDLEQSLRAEIRENRADILAYKYPEDMVTEMVDMAVPIYTSEIMRLAADDPWLASTEPEVGPAFDGSPTPVNVIAGNIYDRLCVAGFEELEAIRQEDDGDE